MSKSAPPGCALSRRKEILMDLHIPPTFPISDYRDIEVPVVPDSLVRERTWTPEQHEHFRQVMSILTFYLEDHQCSPSAAKRPFLLIRVYDRFGDGTPYVSGDCARFATREEGILAAQLANFFRDDDRALNTICASPECLYDQGWLSTLLKDREMYVDWLRVEAEVRERHSEYRLRRVLCSE